MNEVDTDCDYTGQKSLDRGDCLHFFFFSIQPIRYYTILLVCLFVQLVIVNYCCIFRL